jgi:hypothetical protein
MTSVFANYSAAYNILYRTTDSLDQPSWAVTTVLAPKRPYVTTNNHKFQCTSRGTALLSYQIAYDSASVDASPSYLVYNPAEKSTLVDIAAALDRGWFVNVPDYEGPLAAFGAGVQSGHATLDSVRAVLELAGEKPHIGLSQEARYALWGYSGGAIASEWAAELQARYAMDLDFAGVAIGGLTVNATTVLDQVTGTPFAGDIVSGLLGITAEFPKERDFLVSKLKTTGPYNATTFLSAQDQSFAQAFVTFANQTISDYFVHGNADIHAPMMNALYESQGVMGKHGLPRMPLFVYKAIADEFSPVAQTDALVAEYCDLGANILYERNKIGEHVSEYQNGHSRSLEWLSSVFNGTHGEIYGGHGCRVLNVSVVDPTGASVF